MMICRCDVFVLFKLRAAKENTVKWWIIDDIKCCGGKNGANLIKVDITNDLLLLAVEDINSGKKLLELRLSDVGES